MKQNININYQITNEVAEAINAAKCIINEVIAESYSVFSLGGLKDYQPTYLVTNEKIASYLDLVDLEDKENALAVTASGDHTFNLITKGILNIDTFDVNKLTEYIAFGLKKAMILKYNYEEYINALTIMINKLSFQEVIDIISDLLPYMDEKYRIFWKEIIDYNYKIQNEYKTRVNLLQILTFPEILLNITKFNNNYLTNEENYNILRNNIGKANITFNCVDAINLPERFSNQKYDIILLSNILDYFYKKYGIDWNYNDLHRFASSLEKITKDKGIIFLFYNFIYNNSYLKNKRDKVFINNSNIRYGCLTNEEIYSLYSPFDRCQSGIILKRVQK